MPLTIKDCGGQEDMIRAAARAACANLGIITDQELRDCIQEQCDDGTIECENDCEQGLLGFANRFTFFQLFTIYKFETIHLCLNNIQRVALADVILHEWAHTCCWDHGDGKGVPGNDGFFPN